MLGSGFRRLALGLTGVAAIAFLCAAGWQIAVLFAVSAHPIAFYSALAASAFGIVSAICTGIALHSTQQDWQTLFDNLHDASFIHDLDGKVLDVNQTTLEIFGLDRARARCLTIRDDYSDPDNDFQGWVKTWQSVLAGEKHRIEWKARRPDDGSTFDAEVFLRRVTLDRRDVILADAIDVSERVRTENALRRSQAQLQQQTQQLERALEERDRFFDISIDLLSISGLDGYFKRVNPVFETTLGYTPAELYAEPFLNLIHPDDLEASLAQMSGLGRGDLTIAFENRFRCRDGSYRWFAWNAVRAQQDDLIYAIARDITEQKQARDRLAQQAIDLQQALQELQQTQTQMIQSEKMSSLGQMVAGVAHEINNPVNFIHGNLTHLHDYTRDLVGLVCLYQQHYPQATPAIQDAIEELELDFLLEDMPKLLGSMKVGTERIREIVKSLRTFSRLDESEAKAVNIHDGIDSTLTILQSRLKAKPNCSAIEVIRDYAPLPEIDCYPGQLNQVFMNVLSNAIDAIEGTDRPGCIAIFTEQLDDEKIAISISDNGLGIDEATRTKLFDPFFTTKPIGKGTGLGLSISYQIVVDKHGGAIRCDSLPGTGTTFTLTIPRRQTRPPA